MKSRISVVSSIVILSEIILICHGFCLEECGNDLPKRIQLWKSKKYGLEFPGYTYFDKKLEGEDADTQKKALKHGPKSIKSKVDNLINTNRGQGFPDFTMVKMDPISYVFQGEKMLITFKNIKFRNLDTYDKTTATYSQKAEYERGKYYLDQAVHQRIKDAPKHLKPKKFIDRIKYDTEEQVYFLNRRDCKWTIDIKADFITNKNPEQPKPIIIDMEFKIQPDKTKEQEIIKQAETEQQETEQKETKQETEQKETKQDGTSPLRARGQIRIEFHNFNFDLQLIIIHTDDPLRPFFDDAIRSNNRVPDFDVDYNIEKFVIIDKELKLLPYGEDDKFPEIRDVDEQVHEPLATESSENSEVQPLPAEQENIFYHDPDQEKLILQHFEVLKEQIQSQKNDIRKKLCRNLIPKMAWKVMQMETKMQLPYLFHEILTYENNFKERKLLDPITAMDKLYEGLSFIGTLFVDFAGSFKNFWRSKSAPPSLE